MRIVQGSRLRAGIGLAALLVFALAAWGIGSGNELPIGTDAASMVRILAGSAASLLVVTWLARRRPVKA